MEKKQSYRHLTKQDILRLLNQNDIDILDIMNNTSFGFEQFLKNQGYVSRCNQIDLETFAFIMKAICQICNIRRNSYLESVLKFLNMITSYKKFLFEDALRVIYECLDREQCIDFASFMKNYIIVLKTILKHNLSCTQAIIDDAYPALQNVLNEMKNRRMKNVEDLHKEYVFMERLVDRYDVSFLPYEENNQVALFRKLPIMPEDTDVINCEVPDLPCNKIDGPYNSVDHYLSVHFRLLREDMLRTFRDCIGKRINASEDHKIGTQMYKQVNVKFPPTYTPNGVDFKITIKTPTAIDWSRNVLMPGNIVCLTKDNYNSVVFAIISKQPRFAKSKSTEYEAEIRMNETHDDVLKADINYLMFETNAYFECYKHVLSAIKEFDENSFPLSDFLIYLDFQNPEPEYLVNSDDFPNIKYCLHEKCDVLKETHLVGSFEEKSKNKLSSSMESACHQLHDIPEKRTTTINTESTTIVKKSVSCRCKIFNPLDYNDWPTATELDMDEQQVRAFQTALTRKVAVIQGPPGTGKTLIGVKVVKAILHNIPVAPIVVCCRSNHTLDQFLEHISEFTKNIVRIGSQSKSNILEPRNLDNLMIAYGIHSRYCQSSVLEMNNIQKGSLNHLQSFVPQLLKSKFAQEYDAQLIEITHVSRKINKLYENFYICKDEYLKESALNEIIGMKEKKKLLAGSNTNSQMLTTSVLEWLCCSRNTKLYEACKFRFQKLKNLTLEDSIPHLDLWTLPLNKRFELFFVWREKCLSALLNKINKAREEYKTIRSDCNGKLPNSVKVEILKNSHVIGVTTTGAAKYRKLLRFSNPKVLIIEEAAELLESHVISSLLPSTQHLILIGDHKQLRPLPANNELSEVYNLKISLFERLFLNGAPSATLAFQHRMKPCIAELLINAELYPDLRSYENVYQYEDIKCIKSNIFFLNHNNDESNMSSGTSFLNEYEANMIVCLTKYLTAMSHAEEQITILAAYAAQVMLIQKYLEEEKLSVYVTTANNYQGEENDIVLVSFVRSNRSAFIGFLRENNRVCVALSRARKAMFCFGNFSSYSSRSHLWKNIIRKLELQDKIGPKLPLTCNKHGKLSLVEKPEDILKLLNQGCGDVCGSQRSCSHICSDKCHYNDPDHRERYKCVLPCEKYITETKKCPNACFEPCKNTKATIMLNCGHPARFRKDGTMIGFCVEKSTKILPCKHEDIIPCNTDFSLYKCHMSVPVVLPCGHKKSVLCHKSNDLNNVICNDLTPRTSPCGHTVQVPCCLNLDQYELLAFCSNSCGKLLTCGHSCTGSCRWCSDIRIHAQCKENCQVRLNCGHVCNGYCGSPCLPCGENCLLSCSHNVQCINRCNRPCIACEKNCERICKHGACANKCSAPCSVQPCPLPCSEILACGHKCIGLCGDLCPSLCRICDVSDELIEHDPNAYFIQLDDCSHVIESCELQEHIHAALETFTWPDCPKCKKPIQRSLRFKDELLKAKYHILALTDHFTEIKNVHYLLNCVISPNSIIPLEFRDVHQKVTNILHKDKLTSDSLLVLQHCISHLKDLMHVNKKLKEMEPSNQNHVLHGCFEKLLLWVSNNLKCASYQQLDEIDKAVKDLKSCFV